VSAPSDDHALAGDMPDPAWGPSAFWLAWGAIVVLISVLVIQHIVGDVVQRQRAAKAGENAELRALRAEHQAQLAGPGGVSIERAMDDVVREHRR